MIKLKHETFNDGLLEYGATLATYNAKREKTGETWTKAGSLYYQRLSARDSDLLIAAQNGYKIDIKVKTPRVNDVNTMQKVKIDSILYDIKSLDFDNEHLYLYLQKAGA